VGTTRQKKRRLIIASAAGGALALGVLVFAALGLPSHNVEPVPPVMSLEDLSSPWLESKRLPDGTVPQAQLPGDQRSRLVRIARDACRGKMKIPDGWPAFIEETQSSYVVTFPLDYSRATGPGASYYAQVTVDKATGNVIRIWGGS
jgi:hypothetical protein